MQMVFESRTICRDDPASGGSGGDATTSGEDSGRNSQNSN